MTSFSPTFTAIKTASESAIRAALVAVGLLTVTPAVQADIEAIPGPAENYFSLVSWTVPPQQTIFGPSPTEGFGASAAISGNWAVVSSPAWSTGPSQNVGRVHLYHRDAIMLHWSLVQTITPDQIAANGRFGAAVALQGSDLFINQPGIADGATHVGVVHHYSLAYEQTDPPDGRWVHRQTLTSPMPQENAETHLARYFGEKILLSGNSFIVTEAIRDPGGPLNHNLWEVATFHRAQGNVRILSVVTDTTPDRWEADTHITGITQYPILGKIDVSISGATLAVANLEHLSAEGWRTGAVTLFQRGEAGWTQLQVLTPPKNSPTTSFGDRLMVLENSVLIGEFDGVREYLREGNIWVRGSLMSQQGSTPDPYLPATIQPLAARGDLVLANGDSRPYLYQRQGGQLKVLRTFDFLSGSMRGGLTDDTAMVVGGFLDTNIKVSFFTLKDFVVYPGSPPESHQLRPYEELPAWHPVNPEETYAITLKNTGLDNIQLPSVFLSGDNAQAFQVYSQDEPYILLPGQETAYRIRMVNGLQSVETNLLVNFSSVTVNVAPNVYHLKIPATLGSAPTTPDITITETAYLVPLGEAFQLSPQVTGRGPYKYQWQRNGQPITGQVDRILNIPAATPADAGAYTLAITFGRQQLISTPFELVIFEYQSGVLPIRQDQSSPLKMSARLWGNARISWQSSTVATTQDNWGLQGVNTPTLTLTNGYVLPADTVFTAAAIAGDPEYGESFAFIATYSVPLLLKPTISEALSGSFELNQDLSETRVIGEGRSTSSLPGDGFRYSAVGLPPGLQLDPLTGMVAGTFTRAGAYRVTWTLQDGFGGVSAPFVTSIYVGPARIQSVGLFCGLVGSGSIPACAMGGSLQVVIASGSGVSGTLRMGTRTQRFVGRFVTDPEDPAHHTANITLLTLPGSRSTRLQLDQRDYDGLTAYVQVLPREGEDEWLFCDLTPAINLTTRERAAYQGRYTSFLVADEFADVLATPQGSGYMSINIGAASIALSDLARGGRSVGIAQAINVVGTLPDGTAFTASAPAICAGNIVPLYFCGGSPLSRLSGTFNITEFEQIYVHNYFEWERTPRPRARLYPEGFKTTVQGQGARYTAPLKGQLPFANTFDGPENTMLIFTRGGLESSALGGEEWVQYPRLTKDHTVILPPGSPAGRVTRLALNAATGTFTGAFELTDPATPRAIKRTVPFSGLISPILYQANGLFLLPQLPAATSTPPTTLTTSPILSGKVEWMAFFERFEPSGSIIERIPDGGTRIDVPPITPIIRVSP